MSVRPLRLNRVAADVGDAFEDERIRAQGFLRADVEVAHDVLLAFAPGAGAGAAQFLQRDETLRAVLPFQGQFISDLLDICQSHERTLRSMSQRRPSPA